MKLFFVVNKESGEMESYCEVCGFKGIGNRDDPSMIQVDEAHTVVEATQEELDELTASLTSNEANGSLEYGVEVDMGKATRRLGERKREAVPVEAEGIGGREVIAFDEKPVGILRRRVSVVEKKGV